MSSTEGVNNNEKPINDGKGKEDGDRRSSNSGPYQTANQNNHYNNKNFIPQQAKFEGECEQLKGSIYNCTDSQQADMYAKRKKFWLDTWDVPTSTAATSGSPSKLWNYQTYTNLSILQTMVLEPT
jgi:hypothetical protein